MTKSLIGIVDDHEIVRQGLRGLIDSQPDFEVICESGTGAGALQCVEQTSMRVLILDLELPDISGLDVLHAISRNRSKVRVLVLSSFSAELYADDILRAGAAEYVCKGDGALAILRALRRIVADRSTGCHGLD